MEKREKYNLKKTTWRLRPCMARRNRACSEKSSSSTCMSRPVGEGAAGVRRGLRSRQKRPTKGQKRPANGQKGPTKCQKKPFQGQKRPAKGQKRPRH